MCFDLLAAGRSWDPAAMHAAQKAQDVRFFLHYWMEVLICLLMQIFQLGGCTLLVVTPEN